MGEVTLQADRAYVTAIYYDQAWSQKLTASFPVRFSIGERDRSLVLAASWDSRLFVVHGPALTLQGETAAEVAFNSADGESFSLDLPSDVEEVVLQVEALNNYPGENLADVRATTVTLTDPDGNSIGAMTPEISAVAASPWSVEVVVDWVSYDKDVVPAKVSLKSIGPNAAPAGLSFVASYADVVALPTISVGEEEDPPATVSEKSVNGVTELSIVTSKALLPDTQVELIFSAEASDSVPPPFQGLVPSIRLVPPADVAGMRSSGMHESYPVTSSGSQLSTYLSAPSAD